jgi:NadR type nicotinamide-nucleotide adenylyltransferase
MKVGICFGGYCPMHRGHLDAIMKAKKENDKVLLIVCGYEGEERAKEIALSLSQKTCKVKEIFKNDEQVIIDAINDTDLGLDESMCPNNWKIWLGEVERKLKKHNLYTDESHFTFYLAEKFYQESIEKVSDKFNVVVIPKTIPISGTKIRKNPVKYWDYILPPFRETLTKNILITGTASEGKSTLVRDIAAYFNIPFSEEYGRKYMEKKCMLDTDLTAKDFTNFIIGQRNDMVEKSTKSNSGLFISDTDNIVTLMYALAYSTNDEMRLTSEEFETILKPLALSLKDSIKWDKIFLLPPKNKFVDDGTRYMKQSSIEERNKNFKILITFIKEFGLWEKVEILVDTFEGNFNRVKDYINSFYGED